MKPLHVDLTGGLGDADLDMAELAAKAREEMTTEAATDSGREGRHDRRAAVAAARLHGARRRRHGRTSTSTPPTWW